MPEQDQIGRFVNHKEMRPAAGKGGVVRLIYQYEDGEIGYLEGDNVIKFFKDVDFVLGFIGATRAYMLPENFLNLTWRVLNKEEATGLLQQNPPPSPWDKLG